MTMAVSEGDRRLANVVRIGTIQSVDTAGPTAVVDFGDIKSPPLQIGQLRAGALSFWWVPTAGEQVLVACPSGDIAQGVVVASIFAGNAPSGDAGTPMMALGGGKAIIDGDLEVTGSVKAAVEVEAAGVKLTSHKHLGVMPGSGISQGPVK